MSDALRFLVALREYVAERPHVRLYEAYAVCRIPFSMRVIRRVYQVLLRVTHTTDYNHEAPLTDWGREQSHHNNLKAIYDAIDLIAAEDMTPTAADFAGTTEGLFLAT